MTDFIEKNYRILVVVGIALALSFSFLIGQNEGRKQAKEGIVLSCSEQVLASLAIPKQDELREIASNTSSVQTKTTGTFLGSKNGTKYYTPGCSGASRIKPENIIWFENAEDAQLQGYSAATC